VACCVLESCGRYLYRLRHTNEKLTSLMDAMMRLSKAKVSSKQSIFLCRSFGGCLISPLSASR
jgi:regulator of nonsense transcripts 2